MPDDYFDGIPDYSGLAREIGQRIAATRPPNVLAHNGRAFWKLTDAESGALAWLAFTRPDARSELVRRKVWTLIPQLQVFMANWFVSADHELADQSQWIHTNIDVYEARELALLVPQPTAGDIKRITRPEWVPLSELVLFRRVVVVGATAGLLPLPCAKFNGPPLLPRSALIRQCLSLSVRLRYGVDGF